MNALSPAPIRTPAVDPQKDAAIPTPSIWARWFNSVQVAINAFSGANGVGNGANGNIQSPAIGTGTGPANPHLVTDFIPFTRQDGTQGWIPFLQ